MQFRIIEPCGPVQFQRYYDFRWRMLRKPWGQPVGSERDELEKASYHLMVVAENDEILGIGRLHFNSDNEAQVRYMAVARDWQAMGIGTAILEQLEKFALKNNVNSIVLNAREGVIKFYRKCGYSVVGPAETLFDCIAHVKMQKNIEIK